METKRKLYIDFDSTTVNSIAKICELYNEDYSNHHKFKPAKFHLCESWDFIDQCPLAGRDKIDEYFNSERFYNGLQFMENAENIITKLSEKFEIIIVSMGNSENLRLKGIWLNEHLSCVSEYLPVDFDIYTNKSHLDMSDGILIDDSAHNLESSNASLKILYGDIYDWNKNYKGIRKWNWYEIYEFLMK